MMLNMALTAPFAVYVHWPFCLSKCPYCDFNSHVRHGGVDEARFRARLRNRNRRTAARVPGRTVSSDIFRRRHAVADAAVVGADDSRCIGRHWSVAPNVEVTLEANPTSVEATRSAAIVRPA